MSEILEEKHSSQSGHWYKKDGTPAYTIIGKNGKERNVTLRDAKKENLVPSVTTIIAIPAKQGLQTWLNQQLLMSAMTSTRLENEPEQDYIDRIIREAGEQSKLARENGTRIHAWVQGGFEREKIHSDGVKYYESAKKTLLEECGNVEWICEKSFATDKYGGKIDLLNDEFLIDIKTTDKDLTNIKTWDEHAQQLAAYDVGTTKNYQCIRKCGILYINTITAESKLIWIDEEELAKGYKCFMALVHYYYAKSGL